MKNIVTLMMATLCLVANALGNSQGLAKSSATALDLSDGTVEYALSDAATISIEYGSLYCDVEDGEAQFLKNGSVVASGGEASTYDWKPTVAGTYVLKHRMLVYGEEAGTVLTVTHIVTADPEPLPTSGSATSAPISLDLVAAASYALAEGETVPVDYGALYGDVEAGQAQLILNGAVIRTGGLASVYDLKPAVTGVFDLVHRMVDNGVVTGTVLLARVEVTALGGVYVMPILEEPTEDEIKEVLVVAKDTNLVAKVTNETEYVAFREWSGKVQPHGGGEAVGAAGVMAAPNAWVSYALGSETLLEVAPTDADLTVEAFEPTTNENKPGQFDFTVSVKDIEVGGVGASETVKENLKQVLGLEGGTSLEPGGMSSANVEIEFGTPQDGKVKFTAGPKDAEAETFFMKVRVK